MATSPTQRTLTFCRKQGWLPAVVEKWNPHARIRQDLYGGIDLVVIRPGYRGLLGIQATSGGNTGAREEKLTELGPMISWLEAGLQLEVWGWRKVKRGNRQVWRPKRSKASLESGAVCWEPMPEEETACSTG